MLQLPHFALVIDSRPWDTAMADFEPWLIFEHGLWCLLFKAFDVGVRDCWHVATWNDRRWSCSRESSHGKAHDEVESANHFEVLRMEECDVLEFVKGC